MVRPRKLKRINFTPDVTYFKPQAVKLSDLEEVELTFEELEVLRLSNLENLTQTTAAEKMEIHQSTFQRTLSRANQKITDALVNGKAIKINGGAYKMPNKDGTGPNGEGSMTGRQRGNCEGAEPCGRGQGRGSCANKGRRMTSNQEANQGRGLGPCGKGLKRGLGNRFKNQE